MYKIKVKAKKHWPQCTRNSVKLIVDWAVKELGLDVSPIPIHIAKAQQTDGAIA